MCVRTSDRGEPAKISLCSLRTDSMENRPDSSLAGPPSDKISAGNRKAFSMNCPFLPLLDSVTPFLVPTRRVHGRRHREARPSSAVSAGSVNYVHPKPISWRQLRARSHFTLSRNGAEPPESSQPSDGGCRDVSLVLEFASHGNARVLGTGADLSNLTCASARLIPTRVSKTFFPAQQYKRDDSLNRVTITNSTAAFWCSTGGGM